MSEQLEKNIGLLDDDEIVDKISKQFFTEEAEKIARQILAKRGLADIDETITIARQQNIALDEKLKTDDKNKSKVFMLICTSSDLI